jgi:hypothetical protein
VPPLTTEAVLRKPDELGTIFLQHPQKSHVLEFDLVLKAVAEISDGVYVIFHFFFEHRFVHAANSSLCIN